MDIYIYTEGSWDGQLLLLLLLLGILPVSLLVVSQSTVIRSVVAAGSRCVCVCVSLSSLSFSQSPPPSLCAAGTREAVCRPRPSRDVTA